MRRIPTVHVLQPKIVCMLAAFVVSAGIIHGQALQPPAPAPAIDHTALLQAEKADQSGNPPNIESIEEAKDVSAIPFLETLFAHQSHALLKSKAAEALVKLGDKDPVYWNYLVEAAETAIQSDAPDTLVYSENGDQKPTLSPAFEAWVQAQRLSLSSATKDAEWNYPGAIALLGGTGDPRALPILHRALRSPNSQIEIAAAEALSEAHDVRSVPMLIEAVHHASKATASVLAQYLVWFDEPEAQATVDRYMTPDLASTYRKSRADGFSPSGVKQKP